MTTKAAEYRCEGCGAFLRPGDVDHLLGHTRHEAGEDGITMPVWCGPCTPTPTRNHLPDCPRLQYWDGGDSAPCTCGDTPSLESQLHAALAREARLREALEVAQKRLCEDLCMEHEELATSHHPDCATARAALTPSPLADAAAEVLEATVEYRNSCDEFEAAESREEIDASGDRMHESSARLDAAEIRYRSLLREEQEGGER